MDRSRVDGLPVWMLTPKEEKEVFENWRNSAWRNCDEFVKAFAECSKNSGYGVFYKCRAQSKVMKKCIADFQQPEFVDVERDLYIKRKIERLEKEKKEQIEEKSKDRWMNRQRSRDINNGGSYYNTQLLGSRTQGARVETFNTTPNLRNHPSAYYRVGEDAKPSVDADEFEVTPNLRKGSTSSSTSSDE